METKLKQNKVERIQSSLALTKAKELPEGEFVAILSTDDLDRHGEHVSIKGMTIPKRTLRMYFNHITSGAVLPVGQWLKVWKSKDGKLMGHGRIDMLDDFERNLYAKIVLGTVDSVSIGFIPKEYDGNTDTWTKSELSEASVVNEPANPNAVITQKSQDISEEEFEKSLRVKLKGLNDDFVGEPGFPSEEAVQNAPMDKPPVDDPLKKSLEPDTADPVEEPEPIISDDDSEEEDATDTELKALITELKSRVGALEAAANASNESPAIKQLIKLRGDAKKVDKAAEELNKVLRIKLKETN